MNKIISDEIDMTKELINEVIDLFGNNDDTIKKLNSDLHRIEAEQDDLLHEVELAKLNAFEKQKVYDKLKDVREQRRIIKDKLQIATTLTSTSKLTITKGIYAEFKQTVKNLDTLKNTLETRKYSAKVRNDLKCAKENGEWKN